MLNFIKSRFILQYIMSYITIDYKLRLIYLNKSLHSKLEITPEDYKLISEIYKIRENNGIEKVYSIYNNSLIREINPSGDGKEYDESGSIIYIGEFLNGKKNGKGKEYYYSDKLKFEGEYKNGKKWNGKGYDLKGK